MTALTKNEAVIFMYRGKKRYFLFVFTKNNCNFEAYFIEIQNYINMKRFTLLAALVLMVAMPTFAERVTSETARKVASTFLNNNGTKSVQLTDLSKEAGFPNLYIFNADKGFVIMSADDCVQPILGYSLTDIFDTKDMPENVTWWLQGYNDEIQSAVDNKMKASSETAKLWKDLIEGNAKAGKATAVVAPMIQTKWNQNKYYNDLCPAVSDGPNGKAYTGCVATAMAQIMKYWSYPSTGIGSHSYTWNGQTLSANFGATTYDWNNMANYYEYYYTNGTDHYANWLSEPSAEEIAAVATLMYHCGVSVDMNYGGSSTGGSGAPNAYVAIALKDYFNYKNTVQYKQKSYTNLNTGNSTIYYSDSEWIAMLKEDLDAGRPVQYGGQYPSGSGGHAFVCDGYNSDNYFHFNWGWAGHYNGYFSLNNLDTGANSGEAGAGNGVYTRDQEAVFGIEPGSMVPAPTNLTYTLSGLQNITLTWNASNGASSYNVYRDSNLIGNTVSATYSETAPFGTHSYYVRCVDANSQLSLPSNTVTVTIDYPTPIVTDLSATLSGNNANLAWTAPEWCYPEEPLATLTYGDGNINSLNSTKYWAHRYLSDNLSQYVNKVIYKISFYAYETGSYTCYIYKGATEQYYSGDDIFWPSTLMTSKTIEVTSTSNWIDIDLDEFITIDGQEDIWVIMYDPNNGNGRYSAAFSTNTGSNNHGGYWGKWSSGDRRGYILNEGRAFLIRTYVTDGTYTYNLYDGTTQVASNIDATNYTVSNAAGNTAHRYTLKTNYYGGETNASNMAGLTIGNASLNSLTMAANDKMTITENSKLTVSGTLSDVNADNLILENGAQLINNSTGVQATVKKNINGYTGNGGWYTLSTPFVSLTPSVDNGLISGSYDLYAYDEDGDADGKEWINYKSGSFNLAPSLGYLYANSATQTLNLSGELNSGTYSQTVNLSYNNSVEGLKGFNLLGNPTAHEINFTKSSDVSDGYYYADNGDTWIYSTSSSVPAGRGFLVKANATGQTVTVNPQSKGGQPDQGQYLCLSIGEDQTYVKLSEGISMPMIDFKGKHSSLYLLYDRKPYVMLVRNDEEALDLCFETRHNGTQTLTVDASNLDLNYLHLIDNMTGADIDLLATPSYNFEAKATDYATRFRLVFDAYATDGPATGSFAYINNGNIVVNGEGVLQIVDAMGRVIVKGDAINRISTSELTPGVYVLRLINGENVMTQKIVIE